MSLALCVDANARLLPFPLRVLCLSERHPRPNHVSLRDLEARNRKRAFAMGACTSPMIFAFVCMSQDAKQCEHGDTEPQPK